jgi:hypothetical protein
LADFAITAAAQWADIVLQKEEAALAALQAAGRGRGLSLLDSRTLALRLALLRLREIGVAEDERCCHEENDASHGNMLRPDETTLRCSQARLHDHVKST